MSIWLNEIFFGRSPVLDWYIIYFSQQWSKSWTEKKIEENYESTLIKFLLNCVKWQCVIMSLLLWLRKVNFYFIFSDGKTWVEFKWEELDKGIHNLSSCNSVEEYLLLYRIHDDKIKSSKHSPMFDSQLWHFVGVFTLNNLQILPIIWLLSIFSYVVLDTDKIIDLFWNWYSNFFSAASKNPNLCLLLNKTNPLMLLLIE